MRMQQYFFKYINKKRKIASLLKKKNKVYLLTRNLKTKKLSKKLYHVKVGLFFIKKIKGLKTYELNLLKRIRILFNIRYMTVEISRPQYIYTENISFRTRWERTIHEKRILERRNQKYLLKWKKYLHSNNIWKSKANLTDCQQLLKKFSSREFCERNC